MNNAHQSRKAILSDIYIYINIYVAPYTTANARLTIRLFDKQDYASKKLSLFHGHVLSEETVMTLIANC
jgi:hypothetical protein